MDRSLLSKIFGSDVDWHGPCTVLLDANASVRSAGPDSIVGGGAKVYAPRISSGRLVADAVCLLNDHNALLIVQRTWSRSQTGQETCQQFLLVVDVKHVAGVEFENLSVLEALGVEPPEMPSRPAFAPGTLVG